ncbi:MAG TPA: ROK family protein [Blastocatellia bacterium]|jgi:glucokinase|nr:ROK family protein [Blastocatellia bacterium]
MSAERNGKFYLGLDVGRTIRGALVGEDGSILRQRRVVSEVSDPRVFIRQLVDTIDELRSSEEAGGRVAAAGIGWAGLVDQRAQRIEVTPNLIDVSSFDLHEELQSSTGLPVMFDNDANAAAYGEWKCGAARGIDDLFFITLGTGIGAALVLGGQLQRGRRGFAGEFGHFKIDRKGLECACGSNGCLETMASGPNIVRRVRERLFSDPSFSLSRLAQDMAGKLTNERVVQAAIEEDELARSVLEETGRILGSAVASIINLLNIEAVVLGGGVMAAGELILKPIREEAERGTIPPAFDGCRIVAARLGQDAGIIGAALLARDALQPAAA